MNEIRIISSISPKIEEILLESKENDNKKIYHYFLKIEAFLRELKHIVVFIIPQDLEHLLKKNKFVKCLIDSWSRNSQSNIIFKPCKKNTNCKLENIDELFIDYPKSYYVKKLIVSYLPNFKIPLLIDNDEDGMISKKKCKNCKLLCKNEIDINISSIPDAEVIKEKLSILSKNICNILIIEKVASDDLKYLAILVGLIEKVPFDKLERILKDNYFIHQYLCQDIKNSNDKKNLSDIAYSMFRAYAFASSGNKKEAEQFSIEWHPISKNHKILDYKIYKIRVVPSNVQGNGKVGLKRVLMAKKEDKTYFLAYTTKHNFSKSLIEKRIKSI